MLTIDLDKISDNEIVVDEKENNKEENNKKEEKKNKNIIIIDRKKHDEAGAKISIYGFLFGILCIIIWGIASV